MHGWGILPDSYTDSEAYFITSQHDKLIYLFDKGKAVAPAVPAQEGDVMQYVD
jgi:hypothetical protein